MSEKPIFLQADQAVLLFLSQMPQDGLAVDDLLDRFQEFGLGGVVIDSLKRLEQHSIVVRKEPKWVLTSKGINFKGALSYSILVMHNKGKTKKSLVFS